MEQKLKKNQRSVPDRGDLIIKSLESDNKSLEKQNSGKTTKGFDDRGDSKTLNIFVNLGDTEEAHCKPTKVLCTTTTQTPNNAKRELRGVSLLSDMAGRRKLAERYTIRRKQGNDGKETTRESENKTLPKFGQKGLPQKPNNAESNTHEVFNKETDAKGKDKKLFQKVLSKDETVKMFKAVTFMENPLTKSGKSNVRKPSRSSMKTVRTRKTKPLYKRRLARASSPSLTRGSPTTEVAKWAPSCVNKHTKPYYEAWVDTTLAAITRNAEKRACERNLIKSLKVLKRPISPELVYGDVTDEKFTGRIKITI